MIMSELMRVIDRERRFIVEDIIVLKCGGSSIDDLSTDFFENIKALRSAGMKPVIVHCGGPAIEEMLDALSITYEFYDGLRKTTEQMMDIVEMVLVGNVNPKLTRRLNEAGIDSMGLSGSDACLLEAEPIHYERYGLVGEVAHVDVDIIESLLVRDITPVISPIAIGTDGRRYNVNADTAAGAVATALQAKQLIFVTDVPGIMKENELLERVTTRDIETFIADGTIYGGMIPKVKAAMKGLTSHVQEIMIVNGKESEMKDTTTLAGTTITASVVNKVSG